DTIQTVTYYFTPKAGTTGCDNGPVDSVVITVNPSPTQGIDILENVSCYGSTIGKLFINLGRGTQAEDSIQWVGPQGYENNIQLIENLSSGRYTVTVVDNLGCESKDSAFINTPIEIIPFVTSRIKAYNPDRDINDQYHVSCPGGADAELSFFLSALYPPFDYWLVGPLGDTLDSGQLNNFPDLRNYTGLSAGEYTVLVRDAEGCYGVGTKEIKEPPPITFDLNPVVVYDTFHISCNNWADGSINVDNLQGGNEFYSFSWTANPGSGLDVSSQNQDNSLTAGNYIVRVTDSLACFSVDSVLLYEPEGIDTTSLVLSTSNDGNFNINCTGDNEGFIELTFAGGSGQYFYNWSTVNGSGLEDGQEDQSGLTAGTYVLIVEDQEQDTCYQTYEFVLTEPSALSINDSLSQSDYGGFNLNCSGDNNGLIRLHVTGGIANTYIYEWSTDNGSGISQGDSAQTTLTAGDYHVEITDYNGCTIEKNYELTKPDSLSIEITASQITCTSIPDYNDGSANVSSVTGGVGSYSYLWSTGATSAIITELTEAWYFVDVMDANSCVIRDSIWIHDPLPLDISLIKSDFNGFNVSCSGLTDGAVSVVVNVGIPEYTYDWSDEPGIIDGSPDQTNLSAGQYQLIVTDAVACFIDTLITISEPEPISVDVITSIALDGGNQINCHGDSTGTIELDISGGVPGFIVQWNDEVSGATRSGLPVGTYSAVIADANACLSDTSVSLSSPGELSMSYVITNASCPEMLDGEIYVQAIGGINPYSFLWSNSETTSFLQGISAGEYVVKLTDANECELEDSVMITSIHPECLEIPTGFSPNQDGTNDYFEIGIIEPSSQILAELYPDIIVEIFNRWGEMVFRSEKGYPSPWDGTYKGRDLPVDSYHYIIDLNNGTKPIVGNISIVR
ncbi:MAG: gliding motility-associated C-terminal domain-containing protein, partial [Bacteroidota bacterium]|nr:gliding motility-associated C-terminal domain-containing protein [Bacteroidota bacterium]